MSLCFMNWDNLIEFVFIRNVNSSSDIGEYFSTDGRYMLSVIAKRL